MDVDFLTPTTAHPKFFDLLMAARVFSPKIFREILGHHQISYVSIYKINKHQEMLCISSEPSLDYRLIDSQLWRYDHGFNANWYQRLKADEWQSLYDNSRFDELYYLKQTRYQLAHGMTLSAKLGDDYYLFCFAHEAFKDLQLKNHVDDLYHLGQYCANLLHPYFMDVEHNSAIFTG